MSTSKPLKILCIGTLDWSSVGDLTAKGHEVTVDARGLDQFDLIMGPNCARFVPGMEKFLASFLAGARKIKYPEKKK